jgi:hypothetical protein
MGDHTALVRAAALNHEGGQQIRYSGMQEYIEQELKLG